MSDPAQWLILIPLLPLLSAIVTGLLGPRWLKGLSHLPTWAAAIGSCVITILVLFGLTMSDDPTGRPILGIDLYTWFRVFALPPLGNPFHVSLALQADTLSLAMLTAITFVGSWIAKKISRISRSAMRCGSNVTRTTSAWPVVPVHTCS